MTADPTIADSIHRADVADLVVQCLKRDRAQGQILGAIDQGQGYGDRPFEIFQP